MTPKHLLSQKNMITDPQEAAEVLEKELAASVDLFDATAIRVVWESYPKNIHPSLVVAWLRSLGWEAETRHDERDKRVVIFPVILVEKTYDLMFSDFPKTEKVE
jgi:hypothetical protein